MEQDNFLNSIIFPINLFGIHRPPQILPIQFLHTCGNNTPHLMTMDNEPKAEEIYQKHQRARKKTDRTKKKQTETGLCFALHLRRRCVHHGRGTKRIASRSSPARLNRCEKRRVGRGKRRA